MPLWQDEQTSVLDDVVSAQRTGSGIAGVPPAEFVRLVDSVDVGTWRPPPRVVPWGLIGLTCTPAGR